jgi:hypothetical protein
MPYGGDGTMDRIVPQNRGGTPNTKYLAEVEHTLGGIAGKSFDDFNTFGEQFLFLPLKGPMRDNYFAPCGAQFYCA